MRREPSENWKSGTDAELVRAAQRGEKRAFVEIVARYQGMVCGIALAILGDFAASEDAGQEAFLTAWRKIHDLREPERLRGWLAQIARNAALGQLRGQKPHCALDENLELADPAPTPAEASASEDDAMLVRLSLAKLPETYRLPLILFYREGQSVRAVAETLGISEDAVKQRLSRGRELCRDRLSSLIENVLTQTKPSTIFTMAVAVAIGALAAPSAIAATAFTAGAAAGTSAATYPLKTIVTTIMTTSKAFLLATAMVALICVPIGYNLHTAATPTATSRAPFSAIPWPGAATNEAAFAESGLVAQWRALHKQYGTNAQAMPALYKAIKELKEPFYRQALKSALLAEWAGVDPAGGLAFLMQKGHDDNERQEFFREWLGHDPQAAVTALMGSTSDWKGVAHDCLTDIAQAAPDRVGQIVGQLPKPDGYWDATVHDAFAIVAKAGLDSARQQAESLTGPNRDQALAGVASVWAQTDLNAVIAWAKGLPDGTDRNEIIRSALVGKATVDPTGALDALGVVPEGGRQSFFASTTGARVLSAAADADFDGTLQWIANHPGRIGGEDMTGLAGAVTQRLNSDANGFLTARAADGTLNSLMPAISSALLNGSSGERSDVWDWIKTQPPSDTLTSLEKNVLDSAGWQDPQLALQLAADLPAGADADKLLKELSNSLVNGGNMLYRFNQLYSEASDSLRTPLVESAFNVLNSGNISNPQQWVANLQYLPQSQLAQGTESLARAWGGSSPADAIAWANTLPQGDLQNAAAAAITSGWADKDAAGAADWVNSLPPGPERDKSAQALAVAMANQSPADAWNWALSITDSSERDSAATSIIQTLAGKDPNSAQQWIDSGPFSPDQKTKLAALIPTSKR